MFSFHTRMISLTSYLWSRCNWHISLTVSAW
jgi:hypothetical protein